jgi:vancomycin resistance protein YoaR
MPDLDVPHAPDSAVGDGSDRGAPGDDERGSIRARFLIAFTVGLVAALVLGVGALYAYDRQFDGRILPGVRVGTVDLSGMSADEARSALGAAYATLAEGELVLTTTAGNKTVSFAALHRQLDVEGLVAAALAAGRSDRFVDRVVGNARTAIRGVVIEPRVVLDQGVLERNIAILAANLDRAPIDAAVQPNKQGFALKHSTNGRRLDQAAPVAAVAARLADLHAPSRLELPLALVPVEPEVSTIEATLARMTAERITRDLALRHNDERWTVTAAAIRSWVTFAPTADGGYTAVVDESRIPKWLANLAKKVVRPAKDASFLVGQGGGVVGVTAGRNGRRLDVARTATSIAEVLRTRASGVQLPSAKPVMTIVRPKLTTEEAQKSAPLMKRISRWTTYFPIGIKNGFGANIWIPARLIDGYVVAPGATFDFWRAVGPVTREKGYRDGGAIINGRTEPQGALAGGICSCSTTLFNAAMRAGMEMKARRNHYYYIDRYPLGLDATVFISAGGSVQTMSWRNDTKYPVLIRGTGFRDGSAGYVRFELYSVPTGRRVVIGSPTVRNVRYATDTVQYTNTLPPGRSERIEYPVNGMQVWRTVSVYENGKLLRRVTYYSNYARITGITLVGRARAT